jgi:phage baseplate assembly protein W
MKPRRIYKINTLDTNKNRGIGIKLPFDPNIVFEITYSTKEQVKSNLLNFLMTNRGERYFNPDFGADLRKLVFSQMYNVDETREFLYDRIITYFPTIQIEELVFSPNYDTNSLGILLKYRINSQEDLLSIQIK